MNNIITKIEIQKRNKERVNVYINEEFKFACSAELVYIHNLSKGRDIDLKYIEQVIEEDNFIKGKSKALKFLERSYKTESQVYEKLAKAEYSEKTISRIMSFLSEYNFIDDKRYAQLYIKERIRKEGKNKIKYSLLNKGVSEDIVTKALYEVNDEIEYETALRQGIKRVNIIVKSESNLQKILKKLGDYLARKGYNFEIVNSVVNKISENELKDLLKDKKDDDFVNEEENKDKLIELATKRYNIITKSENNKMKIKKKLNDYLLRRGYSYEEIKQVLRDILEQ